MFIYFVKLFFSQKRIISSNLTAKLWETYSKLGLLFLTCKFKQKFLEGSFVIYLVCMYMYYCNKELNNIYIYNALCVRFGTKSTHFEKNVHLGPGQRTLKFLLYKVHYEGAWTYFTIKTLDAFWNYKFWYLIYLPFRF